MMLRVLMMRMRMTTGRRRNHCDCRTYWFSLGRFGVSLSFRNKQGGARTKRSEWNGIQLAGTQSSWR